VTSVVVVIRCAVFSFSTLCDDRPIHPECPVSPLSTTTRHPRSRRTPALAVFSALLEHQCVSVCLSSTSRSASTSRPLASRHLDRTPTSRQPPENLADELSQVLTLPSSASSTILRQATTRDPPPPPSFNQTTIPINRKTQYLNVIRDSARLGRRNQLTIPDFCASVWVVDRSQRRTYGQPILLTKGCYFFELAGNVSLSRVSTIASPARPCTFAPGSQLHDSDCSRPTIVFCTTTHDTNPGHVVRPCVTSDSPSQHDTLNPPSGGSS